jgi:hypothetical protein
VLPTDRWRGCRRPFHADLAAGPAIPADRSAPPRI